ncbi:DNA cytosine methyltransferase [Nocardia alni]|uniref:DNA cytosine methyltransferase n=1 Tax=Nocardia alni TaxID=2815723 RepID=UPI001C21F93B|nr:DNA cytosine methyltransferase [Nocardia alni]
MLALMDWFCGAGGSSIGAHLVPWVHVARAANHWDLAIESHASNFPATDHYIGDIRTAPVERWPVADLLWASPECPQWSAARGVHPEYRNSLQTDLLDLPCDQDAERSRALMEEIPQYLRGVISRGGRVTAGIVENVIEVRGWDQWHRWVGEIRALGYRTRLIAMNSMHAQPVRTGAAPQSRDRLYLAFWDARLSRDPDWDKWLRPRAWCPACDEWVYALQVFKQPHADMGRYRQQYHFRCPHTRCRNTILEPPALPALAAIDWTLPGQRIGDRTRPLADKTLDRIRVGLHRYTTPVPLMVPAGGTWRETASPVTMPMPTRTTRDNDALAVPAPFLALLRSDRPRTIGLDQPLATVVADGSNHALVVPPLLVPMEGRDGKEAAPATVPLRTQTTRAETALAFIPLIAELRGGGSHARPVTHPLSAVTAGGNHHALLTPPPKLPAELWTAQLYAASSTTTPAGTATSAHRPTDDTPVPCDIDDVRFRMLQPHEIALAMAFTHDYIVVGSKRDRVRQLGNAVTPPCAEILVSALVEAITGQQLDRTPTPAPAAA